MKFRFLVVLSLLMIFSELIFSAPKIILKLDDLSVKNGVCQCAPVLDYLIQKKLKAGLGIIAIRNDETVLKTLTPYLKATNSNNEPLFEIWHHGLDHIRPEFQGTGYDYQKSHFDDADKLIKKLLGIQMHTFGSPYNATDSVTEKVFSENPNYKVFMFSSLKKHAKGDFLYLDHRVNMENGTGKPEFDYFVENYNKSKSNYPDYMILQGHPNLWTPEKIEQFKKIIDFLISEGCEFVTPYQYYLSKK